MMSHQKYGQYIDPESAVIKKPDGEDWSDLFGDGVWRSSWFYASVIIIHAKDKHLYNLFRSEHDIDVSLAGTFLNYFHDHCIRDSGWNLPKNDTQEFSRDQLVPLLFLLETVVAFAPQYKNVSKNILRNLIKLEENRRGISDTFKGQIGRNIGYMIDVLCDAARYNLNYRTSDLPAFLVPCLGNIDCAKGNRRGAYKTVFSLACKAHKLTGEWEQSGLEASDAYSVFNALAAVSLQCIAWGKDDDDVKEWRSNFRVHADDGWGPAFKLVSGSKFDEAEIEKYSSAYVTRSQDNDIVMAQRPRKIRDSEYDLSLSGNKGEWLALDFVLLKALALLWES